MHFRIIMFVLLSLSSTLSTARPQEPRETGTTRGCNHQGYDLWEALRVLPVLFVEFDGGNVHWKYQDERAVKLGSFVLYEGARYIGADQKQVSAPYLMQHTESKWLCYYCSRCHILVAAYELKRG